MSVLSVGQDEANAAIKPAAPKLKTLKYTYNANKTCNAYLKWKAKPGYTYQVLRKTPSGKYRIIATKTTATTVGSYVDRKIKRNLRYTYSVRQIKKAKAKKKKIGRYDKKGLSLLQQTDVNVDFQNLKAVVSWKKVPGAKSYYIYRKVGDNDKWNRIATVGRSVTRWTDVYSKTKKTPLNDYFTSHVFIDPSNNPTVYMVRPVTTGSYLLTKKTSYGLYDPYGEFHLEPPTITSLDGKNQNGILTWGTVPHAEGYSISVKKPGERWHVLKNVRATGAEYQSTAVTGAVYGDYFTVRAYANTLNGRVYSDYDRGFNQENRKYGKLKVLYLGDSITFGSPYYNTLVKSFSYPNRIHLLTGVQYFNPSIPGSTWHYDENTGRYRIVNTVAGMVAEGENTNYAFTNLRVGPNTSRIEDYDIVILAAGTNDYNDIYYKKPVFGNRETDWLDPDVKANSTKNLSFYVNSGTKYSKKYTRSYDYDIRTFDGAYNQIYKWIEEASLKRVMDGKSAIKVVSVGLFYSERTQHYMNIVNRNVTKNKYGYTLLDYQKEMDLLNEEWGKSPVLDVYHYDTQSYNIVNHSNCPYRESDNLHFTKFAYGLYGNSISQFLVKNVLDSEPKTVDTESPEFTDLKTRYEL